MVSWIQLWQVVIVYNQKLNSGNEWMADVPKK